MSSALSDYVASTRYTRYREDLGRLETWEEAAERVRDMHLKFYSDKLAASFWGKTLETWIHDAFDAVKRKEVLPSMRSLQFGGNAILVNNARIFNCSFTPADRVEFFREFFWLLLCGTGVGFSVQEAHVSALPPFPQSTGLKKPFTVPDTIEGWALSIDAQIRNALDGYETEFDFSNIRPKGALLKTSGGRAPGPEPLRVALEKTAEILRNVSDRRLRPIEVYDICMHLAKAVLSGGIRRSATICLFDANDEEMKNAKAEDQWWSKNPQRTASNNSAVLLRSNCSREDFDALFEAQKAYGEPGFYFANNRDHGTNPCAEIGLYPYDEYGYSGVQFCNLSTISARGIDSQAEFYRRAQLASIIGTLQAGYTSLPFLGKRSERITEREALLGVSICGILDNPSILLDRDTLRTGAEVVLDTNFWLALVLDINLASRTTCVKPEGTASIVLDSASGIHARHAQRYLRRVRASKADPATKAFAEANPELVEDAYEDPINTSVLTFACEAPAGSRLREDVSALELLEAARTVQECWVKAGRRDSTATDVHHNVSITVNVKADEWDSVREHIWTHRDTYTGVALLQDFGDTAYPQAPLQTVRTEADLELWKKAMGAKVSFGWQSEATHDTGAEHRGAAVACSGGACELKI
ncbi:MAG: recombinase [Caulobacteraceae bacterium]|nr:recombinase [Caulobacteraceae bacterium]